MVKIRLMRVGKRKQPSYRVVVADSRSPRDGRIIEAIGHYQPRSEPSVVEIKNDRALFWLQRGAQASDPVRKLLQISGAWSTFTGEAAPAPAAPRPTAVKATPAASVAERPEENLEDVNAGEAEEEIPSIEDAPTEPDEATPSEQ